MRFEAEEIGMGFGVQTGRLAGLIRIARKSMPLVLTPEQFDAIAQLLRLRESPSREAARLIFVEEMKYVDAAALMNMTRGGVNKVIRSVERGMVLARQAAGVKPE